MRPERGTNFLPIGLGLLASVLVHLGVAGAYAAFTHRGGLLLPSPTHDRPDLAMGGIAVASPRIAGQPAIITATVVNTAARHADPFRVGLYLDNSPVAFQLVPAGLAGDATVNVNFTHTVARPGEHVVKLVADPDGRVAESDESNNELQQRYVWEPPQHHPGPTNAPGPLRTQPGQPDLAVQSLDVLNPRVADEPATLLARIANTGAAAGSPCTIAILVDGKPAERFALARPLAPGSHIDLNHPLTVHVSGPHDITVVADPDMQIDEPDKANNRLTRRFDWDKPATIPIGQKDPSPVTINWISYKDAQKLLGKKGHFDQATMQSEVDPLKTAHQTPLDPTPPTPPAVVAKPTHPAPDTTAANPAPPGEAHVRRTWVPLPPHTSPTPHSAAKPAPPHPEIAKLNTQANHKIKNTAPHPAPAQENPSPRPSPTSESRKPQPAANPREVAMLTPPLHPAASGVPLIPMPHPATSSPASSPPRAHPASPEAYVRRTWVPPTPPPSPAAPAANPATPQHAAPASASSARPTAAPKDDRDASPLSRIDSLVVRPGEVLARQGLEIKTRQPRFSVIALSTSVPVNPDVVVVFDRTGKVIAARVLHSSGYANIDGPLLDSLYRWRAEGEPLSRVRDTLEIMVHIVLVPENNDGDH